MVWIVEMVHGLPRTEGFRSFDIHGKIWPELLTLAEDYGWKPEGTYPRDWPNALDTFKPDYEPEPWSHPKRVSARDAANLTEALSRARDAIGRDDLQLDPRSPRPMILGDEMTPSQILSVNRGISKEFLDELIEFLHSGEFVFAWDD